MISTVWQVAYRHSPAVLRYCKKCSGRSRFVSSGQFRVNANQRRIDVWLIYKCAVCNCTWNLELYARVCPQSIDRETLDGLYANDGALARRFERDLALLRANGAEPEPADFIVTGDDIPPGEECAVTLSCELPMDIRASAVLREKLGISRSRFDKMASQSLIRCSSGQDPAKCRLTGELTFYIAPLPTE